MLKILRWSAAPLLALSPVAVEAQAGPTWIVGKLSDISARDDGMLIRLEGNVQPAECSNAHGWMIIRSSSQIIASTVLSYWLAGRKAATVYVAPGTPAGQFCEVIQFDPVD